MITFLAATSLFTTTAFAPLQNPVLEQFKSDHVITRQISWAVVSDYISRYATTRDPLAESLLRTEASLGLKTWICFTSTTDVGAPTLARKLDGPGIGWPAACQVIRFGSVDQANAAAALIEAATIGN